MARPLRIEYPGAFYHGMNRGLERREIFRSKKDYQAFLQLVSDIHKRFKIILHAYSLMPNHYHLMIETPEANLGRAMRHLDGVYTQNFNKRSKRVGPLFQGRYKALLIEKESYSLQLARYIHLNPVKAKLVSRAEDYEYSSYAFYLGKAGKPEFLETDWLLGQMHKKRSQAKEAFHQFTLRGLKEHWAPEDEMRGGIVLGSESFFEKIKEKYVKDRKDEEIPVLRKVMRTAGIKQIEECVGRICCEEERGREKLMVWALRQYTPLKLKEISERIGRGVSYSAVSQMCRRIESERRQNRKLASWLGLLESEMSNVKT